MTGRSLQVLLYIPIQLVFIPFALIGLIVGVHKGMRRSKKLGVSFSAIQALQYRWFMHFFDTRPDPISLAFIKKFPCESHFGLLSVFGALILSQRLFGFTTRLGRLPERGEETLASTVGHRLLEFDRIVEESMGRVEQVVIPGVGFDLIVRGSQGSGGGVLEGMWAADQRDLPVRREARCRTLLLHCRVGEDAASELTRPCIGEVSNSY